jgi:hypothetical protein
MKEPARAIPAVMRTRFLITNSDRREQQGVAVLESQVGEEHESEKAT